MEFVPASYKKVDNDTLFFFHANAFPPECYISFYKALGSKFNIICPFFYNNAVHRYVHRHSGGYISDVPPLG